MSQVDLPTSIGYALKRTAVALRAAMDAELRQCDLSVAQYASLELLAQRPGLTNAELARGVFVTRQATHQLLAGLRHAGLIEIQGAGRHQRVVITELGAGRLADASHRIALIEQRMLTPLSAERRAELFSSLAACVQALSQTGDEPAAEDRAATAGSLPADWSESGDGI
jgi:DNA-binding MarR family transcriptional regulator